MQKTILITGATDGIGLETAKILANQGYNLLLHGRNLGKLEALKKEISAMNSTGIVETYLADLSDIKAVEGFAQRVIEKHDVLDVLINNAGVFRVPNGLTANGADVRFVVNTIAPYILTKRLLVIMNSLSRVVNLSSAAQAAVDLDALAGKKGELEAMNAYSQSKLAITMWSFDMARTLGDKGPAIIAVNPGSLLASKMVKEGFGVEGSDLSIGAQILCRAALDKGFANASGQYFDNDSMQFADPHIDALNSQKCMDVVTVIESTIG